MAGRFDSRLVALAAIVAAAVVPLAGATNAETRNVQALSDGTPEPGSCGAPEISDIETDNRIAVDPTDPANVVAVWTQGDRADDNTGGFTSFLATVVGVSNDGGGTWKQMVVPGHSGCSLGVPNSFASDPSITFDSDGTLYVGSLNFDGNGTTERVVVSRSFDSGDTWEPIPAILDAHNNGPATDPKTNLRFEDGIVNHELWLTSHPSADGKIYAVWSRRDNRCVPQPTCFDPGGTYRYWPLYFSQTSDGGETWTPARAIYEPPQLVLPSAPQLRVLPDGALLVAFHECDARDPQPLEDANNLCRYPYRNRKLAIRSTDEGHETWSDPVLIAKGRDACGLVPLDPEQPPEQPRAVHAAPSPSLDVGPEGTAYVAWHAIRCDKSGTSRIMFSKSVDGGATWSEPSAINESRAQGFGVSLAADPTGTVGVTYYDFRNDVTGDDPFTTDFWFAHSHNRGASWHETHVAGPFDMRKVWLVPGRFGPTYALADYFGLADLPAGFVASFVQAAPAAEPPSDVFFAEIATAPRR